MNCCNSEKQNTKTGWLPLVLLGLIIGFVPMIVYLRVLDYDAVSKEIFGKNVCLNEFSYYKALWLYIFTGSAMWWFLVNRSSRTNWYHQPLVVYAFFAVLSTVFSAHHSMAFFGAAERCEGLLTHLCYMGVVFLFINLIEKKKHLKLMLGILLGSATLLAIIGLLQFFGYDYYSGGFAQKYLVADHYKSFVNISGKLRDHSIFLTFGNGNFTGSYMTMLFPLSLAFLVGLRGRQRWLLFPANLMLFMNLLGSKSRAGMLGSIIAVFLMAILFRKKFKENAKLLLALVVSYLVLAFVMDIYTMENRQRFFATSIGRSAMPKSRLFGNFEDLKLGKDEAEVVFDGLKMKIRCVEGKVEFYDQFNDLVPYTLIAPPPRIASAAAIGTSTTEHSQISSISTHLKPDVISITSNNQCLTDSESHAAITTDSITEVSPATSFNISGTTASKIATDSADPSHKQYLVLFPENRLRGFVILTFPELNLFKIDRGGVAFFLAYTTAGFRILNQRGYTSELRDVESWGFKGYEGFGSGRGYIWSRSLPMLRKTLLLGHGPDTFLAHYPNNDYLGKLRHVTKGIQLIVDKPHNLYIQIAISTGVISLLAVLALFGVYCHESLRLYLQSPVDSGCEVAGVAIFLAICAYLVTAFFNDSIITVAPVFWSLLGLGIATNRLNQPA